MYVEEVVKVTRNFQITIPASIRRRLNIREGGFVKVVYDSAENVVKVVPYRKKRVTIRLGRKVSVEELEEAVEDFLYEATR